MNLILQKQTARAGKNRIGCIAAIVLFAVMFLIGCGKQDSAENDMTTADTGYSNDVEPEDLVAAVREAFGEDYFPDMQIESQMLEDLYGVEAGSYENFYGEMPVVSGNVDTILIVKAYEGSVDEIKEILAAYQSRLKEDIRQYPANVGKIQASQIDVYGNYVCFVQLGGDTFEALDKGDEAVIQQCKAANEKALQIIEEKLKV